MVKKFIKEIRFRLSQDEKSQLAKAAEKHGVSQSEFTRKAINRYILSLETARRRNA